MRIGTLLDGPTLARSAERRVFKNQHWFGEAPRSDGGQASVGVLAVGRDSYAPKPQRIFPAPACMSAYTFDLYFAAWTITSTHGSSQV